MFYLCFIEFTLLQQSQCFLVSSVCNSASQNAPKTGLLLIIMLISWECLHLPWNYHRIVSLPAPTKQQTENDIQPCWRGNIGLFVSLGLISLFIKTTLKCGCTLSAPSQHYEILIKASLKFNSDI